MANEPTTVHGPDAGKPQVTGWVAHCKVCGTQWQVRSFDKADAQGCQFCGAGKSAIRLENEKT